jgi:hypothetical protein
MGGGSDEQVFRSGTKDAPKCTLAQQGKDILIILITI